MWIVAGSGVDGSPQVRLYRDTDLDTSLSSINDTTDAGSTGTGATTTSISSVDDRVFRQGLANLDANIARVQQSLRQKMYWDIQYCYLQILYVYWGILWFELISNHILKI